MFFVRCYRKGAAKSGTVNVADWEDCPNLSDFTDTCKANGDGKYILFQRGKGIRGMKKVNEYIVEKPSTRMAAEQNRTNNPSLSDLLVFAAEEVGIPNIAVKKNVKATELDDEELFGVIDSLADVKVSSAEEFEAFTKDIKALVKEVKSRGMSSEGFNAEMAGGVNNVVEKEAYGGLLTGVLVGGVTGVGITAYYYKGEMAKQKAEMEERFSALEASMAETEKTVKKQAEDMKNEKKSAEAVRQFDSRLNLDASFLSNFNGNHGPQY
jgi:hypothetical protein